MKYLTVVLIYFSSSNNCEWCGEFLLLIFAYIQSSNILIKMYGSFRVPQILKK
jgi:hypothetical protein